MTVSRGTSRSVGSAANKVRKVAFDEIKNMAPEIFAVAFTHTALQGAGKISGFVKSAISGLGKIAGDQLEAGDLSQIFDRFKSDFRTENMPETYNKELERIVENNLEKLNLALIIEDEGQRAMAVRALKRDLKEEVDLLDQRYRVEPFQVRIMPHLSDTHQSKLEDWIMSPAQEMEWQRLREQIKSVDMFSRALEHATDAADMLKRLRRIIGNPPKPDPKKETERVVKQIFETVKTASSAVDSAIKGAFPYEDLELPDFLNNDELPKDYVARLVAAGTLNVLREKKERLERLTDEFVKERRDKKFIARLLSELKDDAAINKFLRRKIASGNLDGLRDPDEQIVIATDAGRTARNQAFLARLLGELSDEASRKVFVTDNAEDGKLDPLRETSERLVGAVAAERERCNKKFVKRLLNDKKFMAKVQSVIKDRILKAQLDAIEN